MPYVFHPFHVAEQMTDEDSTVVALLHDLIEDTDYTLDDLRARGFSETVVEAIGLMTHEDGVSYEDYLKRIKANPLARTVKLADIAHNADHTRLEDDDPRVEKWQQKYAHARAILEA
jgi:(p)ppGpp synthase/HD superfamily hydrolase